MSDLTPQQTRFVEEYLLDLNATQAAVRGVPLKTLTDTPGRCGQRLDRKQGRDQGSASDVRRMMAMRRSCAGLKALLWLSARCAMSQWAADCRTMMTKNTCRAVLLPDPRGGRPGRFGTRRATSSHNAIRYAA